MPKMPDVQPIFMDPSKKRRWIREKALESLVDVFPLVGNKFSLHAEDLRIDDEDIGPEEHKKAILEAKTLSEPVKATMVLKDADGKVVDRAKDYTLMRVPYLTQHGTFVVNGNTVAVPNQLRMKPGVYTRRRRDEGIEAMFNLEHGSNFRMSMDPEKGTFNLDFGTTSVPLYPVLNKLGVSTKEMGKYWNRGLIEANMASSGKNPDKHIDKLFKHVVSPYKQEGVEDKAAAIREAFDRAAMNPEVNQHTLGKAFDKVTPEALLATSQKLLKAHQENLDYDERDSLAYKRIYGVDDFIAERIKLDARAMKNKVTYKLNRATGGNPEIKKTLPPGAFTKGVQSFLTTSSLAQNPDQINPLEVIDFATKVTSLGEGGIETDRAIPLESRRLHSSQAGFLDPVRTPESSHAGVDLRSTMFAARDRHGNLFLNLRNRQGGIEHVPITQAVDKKIAFPDMDMKKEKFVDSIRDGRLAHTKSEDIDYQIPNAHALYAPTTNLIPFLDSTDGMRATMGAKMMTQALPLEDAEEPWVQPSSYRSGITMNEEIGRMLAPKAAISGTIKSIKDGWMTIRPNPGRRKHAEELGDAIFCKEAAGKEHGDVKVPIFENFPLAAKTYLHHDLKVKVGDKVNEGDLLADSPYTRNGTLSLGKNLRVAYVGLRGMNTNDAVAISESAAKKLTSLHMYREGMDIDQGTVVDRERHRAYYGNKFTRETYEKLDKDGTIKPGMTVNKGDILIAGLQKSELSPDAAMLGKLHKSLVRPFMDAGVTWDHDSPGIVQDVVRSGNKIRLTVKTKEPAQIADKLCFSRDTELLTADGWKNVEAVTTDDVCYTITLGGAIEMQQVQQTHHYPSAGEVYVLEGQQISLRVTPNHNLLVSKTSKTGSENDFKLVPARDAFGKFVQHRKDGAWSAETPVSFTPPTCEFRTSGKGFKKANAAAARLSNIPMKAWLKFLGCYLADGSSSTTQRKDRDSVEYRVDLHVIPGIQHSISGVKYDYVKGVLGACGFKYIERPDRIVVNSKQLALYLKPFGTAQHKHVPAEVFTWGKDAAEWILEGLLSCDGHKTQSNSIVYTTVSEQLADDVQRLALHAGWSANILIRRHDNPNWNDCYKVHIIRAKNRPTVWVSKDTRTRSRASQVEYFEKSDEPVYGVTVPNGTLYTRRNGVPIWTGNSGRHGNKGVISAIIPDDQMIKDEQGRTIDLAISPTSVLTRLNPAQLLETAAGKVAEKMGKPLTVQNFAPRDNVDYVLSLMKQHKVSDKETIFDPVSGKHIPGVLVGPQYTLKLFKTVDTQFSARGEGDGYDVDQQPSKGGAEGSKSLGRMEMNALVAHNARNIIKDAVTTKSERNDEYWRAFQLGLPLPVAKPTFAYNKFSAMLSGAGLKMDKQGSKIGLVPMTDRDVLKMSRGAIENPLFVRAKDLKPEKGGLFDPTITGGLNGRNYAHIELNEPMVNPVFERPVRTLLGMTESVFKDVLKDKGGAGIKKMLAGIDVAQKEKDTLKELEKTPFDKRDNLIKQLKYLRALKENDMSPADAYVLSKIPVIPPVFRPVIPGKTGDLRVSDANYVTQDLMLANQALQDTKGLTPQLQQDARSHLYDATKALFGLAEPVSPRAAGRNVKGYLARIAGTNPKTGFFQGKLVRKQQDLSGRGTSAVDSNLGLDEVGIPEEMGWNMYSPFITKGVIQRGYGATDAKKMVADRHPIARDILQQELTTRPVLINRAPTLHRFNVMAAYPKLVSGKSIRVPEFMGPPMNLDFDGDAQQIHVVTSDKAIEEAKEMTMSKLLLGEKTKGQLMYGPDQDAVVGLHTATQAASGAKKVFKSKEDAMAAYHRGEIQINTPVEIKR